MGESSKAVCFVAIVPPLMVGSLVVGSSFRRARRAMGNFPIKLRAALKLPKRHSSTDAATADVAQARATTLL